MVSPAVAATTRSTAATAPTTWPATAATTASSTAAGNDIAEGTNGADIVDGGSGSDQIYGDIANCSVFCNFDADQLFARDGERDVVDCGGGADTRSGRRLDVVRVLQRGRPPTVPGAPGPAAGTPRAASPLVVAKSVKLKGLLKTGLSFRFRCAAASRSSRP